MPEAFSQQLSMSVFYKAITLSHFLNDLLKVETLCPTPLLLDTIHKSDEIIGHFFFSLLYQFKLGVNSHTSSQLLIILSPIPSRINLTFFQPPKV